jgi:hypothetical protein
VIKPDDTGFIQAGGFAPLGDFRIGKSEPAMSVFGTKLLDLMRREVDNQQPTSWRKGSGRLGNCTGRINQKMQDVVKHDDVSTAIDDLNRIGITPARLTMSEAISIEHAPGDGKHLRTEIETETPANPLGKHFENAAGAGTNVYQGVDVKVSDCVKQRRLNGIVSDVEPSHLFPVCSDGFEVLVGECRPFALYSCVALAITFQLDIVWVDLLQRCLHKISTGASGVQSVEDAGSFGVAGENASVDEESEVSADAGLRLQQHLAKFAHC